MAARFRANWQTLSRVRFQTVVKLIGARLIALAPARGYAGTVSRYVLSESAPNGFVGAFVPLQIPFARAYAPLPPLMRSVTVLRLTEIVPCALIVPPGNLT